MSSGDSIMQRCYARCRELTSLSPAALDESAASILASRLASGWAPSPALAMRYPLRFASDSSEINFLAVMHLLRFGDSFSSLLEADLNSSIPRCIERGLIGLHISGKLDASRLVNLGITDVETLFGIPLTRDERLPNAPAYVSKPTRLRPFAEALRKQLNAAGLQLRSHDCEDFGEFVHKAACSTSSAFVLELASAFPAFNDVATIDQVDIPFYSKAQAFARALYVRFKDDKDSVISAWTGIDDLSVSADAELLNALALADVLKWPALEGHVNTPQQNQAVTSRMRAAAVLAVTKIVEDMRQAGADATMDQVERRIRRLTSAKSHKEAGEKTSRHPLPPLPESIFF